MLKLRGIKKDYLTGEQRVEALKGVDLEFRQSEFISILGPSGCGKTTLLNIIGGLDHYTEGDLIIKGKSTKEYTDKEWDAYRNHSVGFVFQNYNLIPHQTVLSNVEIALTLSGVSRAERRKRAKDALCRVGLADQMMKKPNEMSGGQMQRVAIARAIVNDPEILLADEPTGALDSDTSIQVMEILKEIAKDRLVIMVTHNPELAEKYSTRIIKLKDGAVVGDTSPYSEKDSGADYNLKKNKSMSFFTALGLSVNNLLTKKGRTIMTCFAGSIGIIGIALILSVSNGVNLFIDKVQEDTLSKYPLSIQSEQVDTSVLLESMSGSASSEANNKDRPLDKVYSSDMMYKIMSMMTSVPTSKNNITEFKKYIESNEEFKNYASAIKYSYGISNDFYVKNYEDKIIKVDAETVLVDMYKAMGVNIDGGSSSTSAMIQSYSSMLGIWEELLSGENGELINPMLKEQYEVVYGDWPSNSHEVVLVLTENHELNDFVLYALGLKSSSELAELMDAAIKGEKLDNREAQSWSYEQLCGMTVKLITPADKWQKQSDGSYIDLSNTETGLSYLFNNSAMNTDIKISGIIKPSKNALFSMVGGSIGYTSALIEEIITKNAESEVVKTQISNPLVDVLNGLPFSSSAGKLTDEEKVAEVKKYIESADEAKKAELYILYASIPSDEYVDGEADKYLQMLSKEMIVEMIVESYKEQMNTEDTTSVREYIESISEDELIQLFKEQISEVIKIQYTEAVEKQFSQLSESQLAAMLDGETLDEKRTVELYDNWIVSQSSSSTYEDNLKKLGYVNIDSPTAITIYASSFSDKNKISDLIEEYNKTVEEDDKIKATDYVKLLMSSISTVIDAVSYVLIAFVGISLVVSSIMIGVITNISVLERTKEIGILRSVGASKSDIAHVFNAETFIIGLLSGIIGIVITLLLIIPINIVLHLVTDIEYLNASLPVQGALILVVLSMLLTMLAGLIPSKSASKKDPVVALRSE